VAQSATAPNDSDDEPIYAGKCRHRTDGKQFPKPAGVNWRFRVPHGQTISFTDLRLGLQAFIAGKDFGDFLVWRRDDVPSYQLAVVVDDAGMHITEIVRGEDLLKSTARQILLLRALQLPIPAYYHCELLRDDRGQRLAKRHDALSIRTFRESGISAQRVLAQLFPGGIGEVP
jgi:glutamyl-tRNA synthetase